MSLTDEDRRKGSMARALRIPPRTASPILRAIFNLMIRERVTVNQMALALRSHPNLISNWRSGRTAPSVLTVEEMAHHLGYRLELVPIDKEQTDEQPDPDEAA